MPTIYTAPSMSFLDTYMNAAKDHAARGEKRTASYLEGMTNLVKGGTDAYKWQQRKDILDRRKALEEERKQLLAEKEGLASKSSTPNFDLFSMGYNPAIDTGRI